MHLLSKGLWGWRFRLPIGIYRDAADGVWEKCVIMDKAWKDRVIDATTVLNTQFEIDCSY